MRKLPFLHIILIFEGVTSLVSQHCNNDDICISEDCIKAAYHLLKNMNLSADPCDDFYQFACGRYVEETRIPDDRGGSSNIFVIEEEVMARGRWLLEREDSSEDFESYKLAKHYYKSCLNEVRKSNFETLLDKLKEFGGWPVIERDKWQLEETFNWWGWNYKINEAGFDADSIVKLTINVDDKNTSLHVLKLDQATLGMPREYLIKGFDDTDVQHYYKFMINTAVLLGAKLEVAKEELKESLLFEINLAYINVAKEERRNLSKIYHPTTLGELPIFEGLPASWTEYVQKLLVSADKVQINQNAKVILTNLNYFQRLSNLLKNTSSRTLANYMAWQDVRFSTKYLNDVAQKIRHEYDRAISGIQELPPAWKRCTKAVGFNNMAGKLSLGLVAGSMYVRHFLNPQAKRSLFEMTSYVKKAFKEDILERLDWMDDKTKERAIQKLNQMDQMIAYGDELIDKTKVDDIHKSLNLSKNDFLENSLILNKFWKTFKFNQLHERVDPKSWLEHGDVTVVNAFYNAESNSIKFPAAFLQGVFFNPNVPNYMNYGSIGMVIGHEITHGFDDRGKQRNGNGDIENWWAPGTDKLFKEKAECIIKQYGNFVDQSVGVHLNGISNQGENIADNGGAKASYNAYVRWISDHYEELKIVGLPYSPKQMFWISLGQVWCSKSRDENLRQQILTGTHSPDRFRVTGTLSNNENFAKDFNCPLGSNMNPEKKCSVW